jgi:hypothetical protein
MARDSWRPPRIHPPYRAQARSRHGDHPLAPQPPPSALRLRSALRAKESVLALTSHCQSTYLKGYGKSGSSPPFWVQSYVRLVFPAPGCVAAMLLRRTFVDEDREIPSARACRVLPDCPRHLSAQNSSLIISSSPKAYFREYECLTCRLRLGLPSRLLQTLRMLKDQMTVSLSYRKSLRPCSTKDVRQSVATFCQYPHLWGIQVDRFRVKLTYLDENDARLSAQGCSKLVFSGIVGTP